MSDVRSTTRGPTEFCRICDARLTKEPFVVPEMSMGNGERFRCAECAVCGSIQLLDLPVDLTPYYPSGYYSFGVRRQGKLISFLKRHRAAGVFGTPTLLGGLVRLAAGDPPFAAWARAPYVTRDSRILDVGAGSGNLLREMSLAGFAGVQGVDPFLAADAKPASEVSLRKATIEEVSEQFDTVMLHHVLEHFEDPKHAMRETARITKPGGYAIVRVPVSGTFAWKTFGSSWVQLDPPRHVCVPSVRGMELLAAAGGFEITEVTFDSTAFQFWGSEQVRMGIPLHDPRSVHVRGGRGPFTRREMRSFRLRAQELNLARDGDQACFYLRRPTRSSHATERLP